MPRPWPGWARPGCSSSPPWSATTRRWRSSSGYSAWTRRPSPGLGPFRPRPTDSRFRHMKLVTFDEGRTGRVDGDTVVELDCGSTREYFERGGNVAETGDRLPLASVRLRAPIVPKKFFHTAGNFTEHHEDLERVNWSHPGNKGIVFCPH